MVIRMCLNCSGSLKESRLVLAMCRLSYVEEGMHSV
jgi:hypothetical protein